MVGELEYIRSIHAFTVEAPDGTVLLRVDREPAGTLVTPPVRASLAAIRDDHSGELVLVRVTSDPAVTVLAHVADVARYGWETWLGASTLAHPVAAQPPRLAHGPVPRAVAPAPGPSP